MKTLTLTAIVAGLLVLPFLMRRRHAQALMADDSEKRYDIDDYIEG